MNDDPVARLLASMPAAEVSADFLARVNARIDQTAGWLGLADFRLWTLRLAPAAAALALIAVLWPAATAASSSPAAVSAVSPSAKFSPAVEADWQQEVSSDALLAAALTGAARVR
jgi:hypothetical protein